jgi:hypothetical protein
MKALSTILKYSHFSEESESGGGFIAAEFADARQSGGDRKKHPGLFPRR